MEPDDLLRALVAVFERLGVPYFVTGSYQQGNSEKHLRDIASILRKCGFPIDREYIAGWAAKLGV